MKTVIIALAGLMLLGCDSPTNSASSQPATQPTTRPAGEGPGAWSQAVNGLQARITLKRTAVINGTPIISTFLELRNISDVGNPMKLVWALEKMKFQVTDADGHELHMDMGSYDGPAFGKHDLVIPHGGVLSFDISSRGLGISGDQAGLIDLGPTNNWVFKRDGKNYYLRAVLEVPPAKVHHDETGWNWDGRIEIPPVQVPLKPEPADPAKTDELIEQSGAKMLGTDSSASEKAARALSLIDDERVIPWYVKAIRSNRYELKFAALDRLSRFNTDEALAGLKIGMATSGADIGYCTTDAVAAQMADNIRHSAACALSRSPHPGARILLLSLWNDPSRAVRITVLHALGRMDSAESLRLLKKMSKDTDEDVRKEALRYLKLREAQPATAPATQPAATHPAGNLTEAESKALADAFTQWLDGKVSGSWQRPTKPGEIVRSGLDVVISAPKAALVTVRTHSTPANKDIDVLTLPIEITNRSATTVKTKIVHEWYGGEWPLTDLFAAVIQPGKESKDNPSPVFSPVFLVGEKGELTQMTEIKPGESVLLSLRMDWPGTGSVHGEPLVDGQGTYKMKLLMVFEADGKKQVVESGPIIFGYQPTQPATQPAEPQPAAVDTQGVQVLHDLLASAMPADWEILPIRQGKVAPAHRATGEGLEIVLQTKKEGSKGRSSIHVWIMHKSYEPIGSPSLGPYQKPGSREVRRWQGRRVFVGGDMPQPWLDWKQMNSLLDRAFKTTATQPEEKSSSPQAGHTEKE